MKTFIIALIALAAVAAIVVTDAKPSPRLGRKEVGDGSCGATCSSDGDCSDDTCDTCVSGVCSQVCPGSGTKCFGYSACGAMNNCACSHFACVCPQDASNCVINSTLYKYDD